MITKGYIEAVVDKQTYTVRLPVFDKVKSSNFGVVNDKLSSASVCSQLNCDLNLQVGDVVFVGFEDNSRYKPVILGCLSSNSNNASKPNIDFNTLSVTGNARLSKDTTIGKVSYENLQHLKNLSSNAQEQIDSRLSSVSSIKAEASSISKDLDNAKIKSSSQLTKTNLNSTKISDIQALLGSERSTSTNTVYGLLNNLSGDISNLVKLIGDVPKDNTLVGLIENLRTRLNYLKSNAVVSDTTSNNSSDTNADVPTDSTSTSTSTSQTAPVYANEATFKSILAALRNKFPHGKYWNHMPNEGTGSAYNNQDGWTDQACSTHNGYCGTSKQTCNGYAPDGYEVAWQCMGYADKCGYDVTGHDPRSSDKWKKYSSKSALDSLKPGDIIRYKNDGHSIYVTGVDGDLITFTDCNSDGHCIIRWDATEKKSKIMSSLTYVRSAPTDLSKSRLLRR